MLIELPNHNWINPDHGVEIFTKDGDANIHIKMSDGHVIKLYPESDSPGKFTEMAKIAKLINHEVHVNLRNDYLCPIDNYVGV